VADHQFDTCGLYSYITLLTYTDIRLFDFYRKRGLGDQALVQIKVIITSHDFGPDYTLYKPKLHESAPSEYTLYWKIFNRSVQLQTHPFFLALFWLSRYPKFELQEEQLQS